MKAIILAAGTGNRLGNLTAHIPKALVNVNGQELIRYVFAFLDHPMISCRTVVTGYHADKLTHFLATHFPNTSTIFNPFFQEGSIRSLETALPAMDDAFLLMNTDHIYPKRMLSHILEQRHELMAICDFDRKLGEDDMKVVLDENQKLKDISKTLVSFDGGYIGMTSCEKSGLPLYQDAVRRARSRFGDAAPAESALRLLAIQGKPISICDTSGISWLEVDTPQDLVAAESTLHRSTNFLL